MARSYTGQTHIFFNRREVMSYIRDGLLLNNQKKIGLELELFVVDAAQRPIAYPSIVQTFQGIQQRLESEGYQVKPIQDRCGLVGLDVLNLGTYSLEPGGQIEVATCPALDATEMVRILKTLYTSLEKTLTASGYRLIGEGYHPGFSDVEIIPRSRFAAYGEYCVLYGAEGQGSAILPLVKSTCSLQFNIDSCGLETLDTVKILMVLEPILAALTREGPRHRLYQEIYCQAFPRQTVPLYELIEAKDFSRALAVFTDHFLSLALPFKADSSVDDGFVKNFDTQNPPPTLSNLLDKRELTADMVRTAMGLSLVPAALRRPGVFEMRMLDATADVQRIEKLGKICTQVVYNTDVRQNFLKCLHGMTIADTKNLYDALARLDKTNVENILALPLSSQAGTTVADIDETLEFKSLTLPPEGKFEAAILPGLLK